MFMKGSILGLFSVSLHQAQQLKIPLYTGEEIRRMENTSHPTVGATSNNLVMEDTNDVDYYGILLYGSN